MVLQQAELQGIFPQQGIEIRDPSAVEQALAAEGELPNAGQVQNAIEAKKRVMQPVFSRMDEDESRLNLDPFVPDIEDSVQPEDAITTNSPRVLSEKVVAFIAATQPIIRAPGSEKAGNPQEDANDAVEQLAIGMYNNANRRLRRKQFGYSVHETLGWFSTNRGRYAAARAVLRKRPNGETYDDILPLDPRHLFIQQGDEEPIWAAYRLTKTKQGVRDEYPNFNFSDTQNVAQMEDTESVEIFEYYARKPNPFFDPQSQSPFDRHPWVYLAGTVIDSKWAREPHNLFMLTFPVVAVPVGSRPMLTPAEGVDEQQNERHFGESVFAENREVWDKKNRAASYVMDLMAKASDPRKKVRSLDGTASLDEGSNEKGAEIPLATADGQDVENYQEADLNRAAGALLQLLSQDEVQGGLPPQAFGILDKPLSSVALRQLGNNLEHRILPRLRAVAACIEGCLENLIAQYETGAFAPITVSGRRFDNHIFSNRIVEPEDIAGHDPVIVKMELALPEDQAATWQIAQMAMAPTASGEPLGSLEWVRENVLKLESSKAITNQNFEMAGVQTDELAQAKAMFESFMRDNDVHNASIWFDKLQALALQRQVQTNFMIQQLRTLAAQANMPIKPAPIDPSALPDQQVSTPSIQGGATVNQGNPAFGASPSVEFTATGNQPSPEAGFNTTAPRQRRSTGLVDPNGQPLFAE